MVVAAAVTALTH